MNDTTTLSPLTITEEHKEWLFRGPLTMKTAAQAAQLIELLPLPSSGVVDFTGVEHADSSALSLLLVLLRRARREQQTLQFRGVPETMRTLAHVYGLDELLLLT